LPAESHKTRRAALGAFAAALVIPNSGAGATPPPDPIFSAIERHKAAWKAREAASFAIDDLIYNSEAREVSQAEWDAYERANDSEETAFDELLTVEPRTAGGMRAIIVHLVSLDDGRLSRKMRLLLAMLLKSRQLTS
jgi:hypothetical protein